MTFAQERATANIEAAAIDLRRELLRSVADYSDREKCLAGLAAVLAIALDAVEADTSAAETKTRNLAHARAS
jgi:hypothetical protein